MERETGIELEPVCGREAERSRGWEPAGEIPSGSRGIWPLCGREAERTRGWEPAGEMSSGSRGTWASLEKRLVILVISVLQ